MTWRVLHTKPYAEPDVRREVEKQGHGCFLPWLTVVTRRGDRLQVRQKPVLPGYVFVALDDENWSDAAHVSGVNRILMAGDTPAKVEAEELAPLMLAHATGALDQLAPRRNAAGRFCRQRKRRRRRPRPGKVAEF